MFKRTLGLILALLMVLSMSAMAEGNADWRTPYDETIVVHVSAEEQTSAIWAEGEDATNNLWTKLWKDRYNVEVVVDWVSTEYETKMNLAIASGELPDMFPVKLVQFEQLKAAGLLEDLTEAVATTASPSLMKMINANPDLMDVVKDDNGALLAIPQFHYGFETMTGFIWMRKDWVDANGIEQPKSIDDIEAAMKSFIENNGATYGTTLDKTLNNFYRLAPGFHVYPEVWVPGEDGTLIYGSTAPEMKKMLETWARWYEEGLINPDFGTMTEDAAREDFYNGLTGLYAKENWAGWQIGRDMVANQGDGTYFIPFDIPSIDSDPVKFEIKFATDNINVVRKGYEHPEVLVKLINNYVDVLDDAIGAGTMTIEEVLPFNTNEMHHVTGPFKVMFAHYNDIKQVSAAVEEGGGPLDTGNAYLFYNEILKWVNDGDVVGMGRWLQMGSYDSSLARAIAHVDENRLQKDAVWGMKPQVVLDYGTTLKDLLDEGFTEIIIGVEDVDYFDTLVENWKAAGGQECMDAVNAAYGQGA